MKLVICLSVYILLGLFALVIASDCYSWDNPLWEIAIILLWPLAFLIMIVSTIEDYIDRVKKYYKKKGGRKNGKKT